MLILCSAEVKQIKPYTDKYWQKQLISYTFQYDGLRELKMGLGLCSDSCHMERSLLITLLYITPIFLKFLPGMQRFEMNGSNELKKCIRIRFYLCMYICN